MVRLDTAFAASIAFAALIPSIAVAVPIQSDVELVERGVQGHVPEDYVREFDADWEELITRDNSGEL